MIVRIRVVYVTDDDIEGKAFDDIEREIGRSTQQETPHRCLTSFFRRSSLSYNV